MLQNLKIKLTGLIPNSDAMHEDVEHKAMRELSETIKSSETLNRYFLWRAPQELGRVVRSKLAANLPPSTSLQSTDSIDTHESSDLNQEPANARNLLK